MTKHTCYLCGAVHLCTCDSRTKYAGETLCVCDKCRACTTLSEAQARREVECP